MSQKFNITSIHQKGQRDHNEDSIFPNEEIETTNTNLFLVCDGVGGHAKGEIASDLVCTQIDAYFSASQTSISNENVIDAAIKFVETKFDSYIVNHPEAAGMGSTLTLLHLHQQGATIAHIGDSRVYQFRGGKIHFRTKDHSLVQNLFDIGELKSEEEMMRHPRRNEITRAIQGASIRKTKADVSILSDIKAGDIFLLCTDGILESFNDRSLEAVFGEHESIDTIAAAISVQCTKTSNDNFSAYFVEVNKEYVDTLSDTLTTKNTIDDNKNSEEQTAQTSETDTFENDTIAPQKKQTDEVLHIGVPIEKEAEQSHVDTQDAKEFNQPIVDEAMRNALDKNIGIEQIKKEVINEELPLKKEVIHKNDNINISGKERSTSALKNNRYFWLVIGLLFTITIATVAFFFSKKDTKESEFEKIRKEAKNKESGQTTDRDELKEEVPPRNDQKKTDPSSSKEKVNNALGKQRTEETGTVTKPR
ncbi:PP2C family protein-serine/threonine phosphatase [Tannerella forsythia]|uniref:Serine/threonine-protein phosphatase n=1 Tax=Tannerella forsythia TaxID=28112 RepID=A0A3P1XIR4_TANFO|nr:protein phosphatase 2C domain-containing protein [Tannerella forsythia]RRD58355.1 serine/threonine-protein phosphatase [Tannerella forsythia]